MDKFCCSGSRLLTLCLWTYKVDQSIFGLSNEKVLHSNEDIEEECGRETCYQELKGTKISPFDSNDFDQGDARVNIEHLVVP